MVIIHSERLLIRDHIESDLSPMHAWVSDQEVMKYLNWKTSSLTETKNYLDDAINENCRANRKKYFFAVVLKDSGEVIGDVGFTVISRGGNGGVADSGFFLLKEYWGAGYATEAFNLLIKFAFTQACIHKVIAGCDAENEASKRVMIKCGLSKEGEFKQHLCHRDKWCDRLKYGLLKEDWIATKHATE